MRPRRGILILCALLAPGEETPAQLKVGEAVNRATGERNTRLGGGKVVTPGPQKR